jgi:photosystem II stability/assembly factor-like uncharacterized protein
MAAPAHAYDPNPQIGVFVDDTTGFAAGTRATLLKNHQWRRLLDALAVGLPSGLTIHSVYFIDRLLGWVAADCFLYRPLTAQNLDPAAQRRYRKFHAVHFLDAKRGWIAGTCFMNCRGRMISYTSDGGKTWTDTPVPFVKALSFPNGMHGWAASIRGNIHKFTGALERSNTVRGTVFEDRNNNCVRDAGEAGMAGIAVRASPGRLRNDRPGRQLCNQSGYRPVYHYPDAAPIAECPVPAGLPDASLLAGSKLYYLRQRSGRQRFRQPGYATLPAGKHCRCRRPPPALFPEQHHHHLRQPGYGYGYRRGG